MSINPTGWDSANQQYNVWHDEFQHGGVLTLANISWGKNIDGSNNHRLLAIDCPGGCNSTSYHPIGGGSAPRLVQELFVRAVRRSGCPCTLLNANQPWVVTINHVKGHCEQMDFVGRWQVTSVTP